ncbi:MAG: hydantoinase B/oxoprolinase family protein [Dehalococcoidia bacterium]|nr:hydantoinase B/oxoprolinase family protein [Dehalococcoidia bacterium]
MRIGVDVGGTFTDLVAMRVGDSAPAVFKTPTTPDDPSLGVVNGIEGLAAAMEVTSEDLLGGAEVLIHGTTVATNTLVERKGARVGLITTEGFRDLLEIREGLKEDRYNLRMDQVEPLAPRYLRVGVPERVDSSGMVRRELDVEELKRQVEYLQSEGVDSVAICFLFSFLNPDHEREAERIVREMMPDAYVSSSHVILPQIKEFDRLSTTTLNAYVGPSLASYLRRLEGRITEAGGTVPVFVIQSNGGIAPVSDSSEQAVRSILSGPAGGAAGAAHVARQLGEERVIALDMGGTSTDITLIEDGTPHVTGEKFEAGWKIAVPTVDIHTLGAGGGSIARVDEGGVLRVGPTSAGADPGPACYGKGGTQPTVTDAALVLGLLNTDKFLGGAVQLDEELAIEAICSQVAEPLGLDVESAAEGILRVVSSSIAEGIRLASVSRGLDPREFALMGFGGAAGLVTTRVAREIGISRALIPPAGPVLSAFGMMASDLKYDLAFSHPSSLSTVDLDSLRSAFNDLDQAGRNRLLSAGATDSDITVTFSADMRYLDQIYEVTVEVPDLNLPDEELRLRWAENMHIRFERLYAYRQQEQDIRIVTLRASAVGRLPAGSGLDSDSTEATANEPSSSHPATQGPSVINTDYNTVVVGEGCSARLDSRGVMHIDVQIDTQAPEDTAADSVTLSVVGNRLESIAIEMMDVMLRTALSQILNASRDFSTAILDSQSRMVAQGEGIPVHMSALPVAGRAVLDYFGDDIAPGDVFLLNDPYFGGSHLPDLTVIRPVFVDGDLVFMTVNRAHHTDVGGGTHGGYNPSASEIFHEGLRIPPLRIYDRDVPRDDLLQMMAANVRTPKNFLGDLNAQIGSVLTAERRIRELVDHYGVDNLTRIVDGILEATEAQVRSFISEWPDGVYYGESLVDDDGFDSELIPIRAAITIAGDTMTIDLSESASQVTGFINSAYANTRSLAHAAIMYVAPYDVPKNEGSMGPLEVIAPKGLIVNANAPAPVCMSTNHCAEEIVEAIFKALSQAVPEAVNAGFSRRLRYAITGIDPRTGESFLWHFFMARGGGGASQGHDGWSCVGEVNVAGGIRANSVEVTEERFPLFVVNHELRPGSAGEGEWRGGLGAVCEIVYEGEGDASLNTAGDGAVVPPFGVLGGEPGLPHRYSIVSNGTETVLPTKQTGVVVRPGDRIVALSSGGGGYGDPAQRSSETAAWDAKNGYV